MVFVMCVVYVFFFKQKTAYEMRISDWSSDVCSSDLPIYDFYAGASLWGLTQLEDQQLAGLTMAGEESIVFFAVFSYFVARAMSAADADEPAADDHQRRSEERRVGKEWVSTCSCRW